MANASRKHVGAGTHGKGAGVGAMTDVPRTEIPESGVLSNRQKSQHDEARGLDSKDIQTEQLKDHESNHLDDGKV